MSPLPQWLTIGDIIDSVRGIGPPLSVLLQGLGEGGAPPDDSSEAALAKRRGFVVIEGVQFPICWLEEFIVPPTPLGFELPLLVADLSLFEEIEQP